MSLIKTICVIQYQVAKLEVIEDLFRYSTNIQATLETQVAYNMVSTLRKKLFEDAEVCLDLLIENQSKNQIKISIYSLRSTIVSVNNLLLQMSSGVNTPDAVWVKILFTNIVTELMQHNSALETDFLLLSQGFENDNPFEETLKVFTVNTQLEISVNDYSISNESDNLFKKLVSRCLGDYEQAQRLIEYELRKNQGINREEAIGLALTR
jgi:hypothetical protein